MSTLTLTHAAQRHASGNLRPFWSRLFDSIVAFRTAQAQPRVVAALANASDDELQALGRSRSEIKAIRAYAESHVSPPIL